MEVKRTVRTNGVGDRKPAPFFYCQKELDSTIDGVILYTRFGKIQKSVVPANGNLFDVKV